MIVIRSAILGFCKGVRRAVEMARRESSLSPGRAIFTLGPLIHNPVVLGELEARGVKILEEGEAPPDPENSTLIIRSHGISPELEESFARQGARLLDATCPCVKASQGKARTLAEKGSVVFLAGEEGHGEIIGLRGYVKTSCYVVADPAGAGDAAAELARNKPDAKTALIGQTTISPEEYRAIGEAIKKFFPGLEIVDTICGTTAARQDALRELCAKTDAVIIAGGRGSANTRRLLSLARELGKPAWLVESPSELPAEIGTYERIGLSAGASTPDSLITEIENTLNSMGGGNAGY